MCGIVAYSGKKDFNSSIIKMLMLSNLTRGMDATGIYSPKNGLKKDNINATAYFGKPLNNIKKDKVFIGHLRAKTFGENSAANAHPFEYPSLVGVHNGTLIMPWELAKKYNIDPLKCQVDSQVIYSIINDQIDTSDNNVTSIHILSVFEGAAALIYYNKEDGNLYVYRNKERPLHFGFAGTEMYIASMEESLELAGCTDIEMFDENYLFKIKDGVTLSKTFYMPFIKPVPKVVTYGNNTQLDAADYLGFWFQAKYPNVPNNIKTDEWYYVSSLIPTKYDSKRFENHNVNIINKDGKEVEINKHTLDTTSFYLLSKVGTIACTTSELRIKGELLMEEGDLVEVVKISDERNGNNTIDLIVCAMINDRCYTIQSKYLRAVTQKELLDTLVHRKYYNSEFLKKAYSVDPLPFETPLEVSVTLPTCDFQIVKAKNDKRVVETDKLIKHEIFYDFMDIVSEEIVSTKRQLAENIIELLDIPSDFTGELQNIIEDHFYDLESAVNDAVCIQAFDVDDTEFCDITY